jgi:type IV pilus assembly protein PilV
MNHAFRRPMRSAPPRSQRGVGLIEVLIALVVLAFGLLGIAAMQLTALRNSQSALQRSQAVAETYAILDAMRANADRAKMGAYNIPRTCTLPDAGDIVANDLRHWISSMKQPDALGADACGTIACGARECTITVEWDDSRATGGEDTPPVITTTQL